MLRFTTRDLLWLMLVVGLACGWWISLAKAHGPNGESNANKSLLSGGRISVETTI